MASLGEETIGDYSPDYFVALHVKVATTSRLYEKNDFFVIQ